MWTRATTSWGCRIHPRIGRGQQSPARLGLKISPAMGSLLLLWATPALALEFTLTPSTVQPGDFFVISLLPEGQEEIRQVKASVVGTRPKFYAFGAAYKAIAALPSSTLPGLHRVYLKVTLGDGRTLGETLTLTVLKRDFPRQHLRVSSAQMAKRTEEALARDRAKIRQAIASSHPRPLWKGTFLQPLEGRISTEYGLIRLLNGRETGRHNGVDIAAPAGTPVKASNSGLVVLAAPLEVHGQTIILDHGCNVFSIYLHLSTMEVKPGQRVQKGQVIGRVGATGFATGPHLHWALRVGEVLANPWNWLESVPTLE